jgi:hypothetical protein
MVVVGDDEAGAVGGESLTVIPDVGGVGGGDPVCG